MDNHYKKYDVIFKWAKINPFSRSGRWRRRGFIEVTIEGLILKGKRVFSGFGRFGIIVLIMVISFFITMGYVILGIIPALLLANYVFLKEEHLFIPFNKIDKYAIDSRRKYLGFSFSVNEACNPVVFSCPQWVQFLNSLRAIIPHKDATSQAVVVESADGVKGLICPQCGMTDIRKAYIEDGSMGDWCPNCKKSIQKMAGEI